MGLKKYTVEIENKEYLPKVISIFGTKGGTGKTTIAVNLAVALQKKGMRVVLLDLDLQFGDVGVFMDIPQADTISELIAEGMLNEDNIISYLHKHTSGVQILSAPSSPELAEMVKPEYISQIIEVLKKKFDYVMIDLGPALDEVSLQALDLTDSIYFVTNPEISTLKNTKVCLNVMDKLGVSDKVKLILNKNGESFIKKENMEDALDKEIVLSLSRDSKNVIASINRGIPIILANPKSKVSRELTNFVATTEI